MRENVEKVLERDAKLGELDFRAGMKEKKHKKSRVSHNLKFF